MKTLYLVRHSKSSRAEPGLPDISRPLIDRGMSDARMMGLLLKRRGCRVDHIFSSPATRAVSTTQILAEVLKVPDRNIVFDDRYYYSPDENWMTLVNQWPAHCESIMLVGHDPFITRLADRLAGGGIVAVPTTGIARFDSKSAGWDDLVAGNAQLVFFEIPKNHRKGRKRIVAADWPAKTPTGSTGRGTANTETGMQAEPASMVSVSMPAANAIARLHTMKSAGEIRAFTKNDQRITVRRTAASRLKTLAKT